ncbi:MAG TPA: hypothetical protein VGA16_09685 [Candidatus Limnocylindria bacterium]
MRGWVSLGTGWLAAAVATVVSTQLSLATGLIFHLHPVAIALGAAWVYRTLNGERPCTTHGLAFLFGLTGLLSANATALRPIGLTDPDVIAGPIAIAGLAGAAWVLFRRQQAPVARPAGRT